MSIRIGLGIAGFPFEGVASFCRWLDLCDASGVDSIWVSDRLASPQPTLEPITTLSVIAGRTTRLKFGMNAIVLPFRDPLVLAKECATLDFLSDGRLLPVFGVGAEAAPEWRATGRDARGRGGKADEMIEIMTRLWSEESVTYAGHHYQYDGVGISPHPRQQPLPLWIGGSSEAAIRRTARFGTGWLGGIQSAAQVGPVVARIRSAAAAAGRPIDDDHYGAGFSFRFGAPDDPLVEQTGRALARFAGAEVNGLDMVAAGEAPAILQRVQAYVDAGISKFVLRPIARTEAEFVDQTKRLIEEVVPVVHGW